MERRAKLLASVCVLAWAVAGCEPASSRRYRMLQDEDPAVRLEGIRLAAKADDAQALSYLVDRLTDSEADVRFFAILTLERLADLPTDRRMGYRYYDPLTRRNEAVKRWRRWLAERSGDAPGMGGT